MKPITLEVLASPNCHICAQFEQFWKIIAADWPNVSHRKIDVTTDEGQTLAGKFMILASPGIILNGQLWAVGGFNRGQFVEKLKELS